MGSAHETEILKYSNELCLLVGRSARARREERSTSITKQLVFSSTRFAVKRAVIEFWSVFF
jgi:hypothetical protein